MIKDYCDRCKEELSDSDKKIGKNYGSFTVLRLDKKEKNSKYYLCRCSCGNEQVCKGDFLVTGRTKRCFECKRNAHTKHGMRYKPIYAVWREMKSRCLNPNNYSYQSYGGRGISVCERWMEFIPFYEDMGDAPEGMQIDRIDNDKGYSKENCRWATPKQNYANRGRKNNGE